MAESHAAPAKPPRRSLDILIGALIVAGLAGLTWWQLSQEPTPPDGDPDKTNHAETPFDAEALVSQLRQSQEAYHEAAAVAMGERTPTEMADLWMNVLTAYGDAPITLQQRPAADIVADLRQAGVDMDADLAELLATSLPQWSEAQGWHAAYTALVAFRDSSLPEAEQLSRALAGFLRARDILSAIPEHADVASNLGRLAEQAALQNAQPWADAFIAASQTYLLSHADRAENVLELLAAVRAWQISHEQRATDAGLTGIAQNTAADREQVEALVQQARLLTQDEIIRTWETRVQRLRLAVHHAEDDSTARNEALATLITSLEQYATAVPESPFLPAHRQWLARIQQLFGLWDDCHALEADTEGSAALAPAWVAAVEALQTTVHELNAAWQFPEPYQEWHLVALDYRLDQLLWPRRTQTWVAVPVADTDAEGYFISPVETPLGDYRRFLRYVAVMGSDRAFRHPEQPLSKRSHEPVVGLNDPTYWPVRGIDFWDAWAYCQWAGLALPTPAEWTRAAMQHLAPDAVYPWAVDATGLLANTRETDYLQPLPCRSLANAAQSTGMFHLIGNVAEWTDAITHHDADDAWFAATMGGSFLTPLADADLRQATPVRADWQDATTGMRPVYRVNPESPAQTQPLQSQPVDTPPTGDAVEDLPPAPDGFTWFVLGELLIPLPQEGWQVVETRYGLTESHVVFAWLPGSERIEFTLWPEVVGDSENLLLERQPDASPQRATDERIGEFPTWFSQYTTPDGGLRRLRCARLEDATGSRVLQLLSEQTWPPTPNGAEPVTQRQIHRNIRFR